MVQKCRNIGSWTLSFLLIWIHLKKKKSCKTLRIGSLRSYSGLLPRKHRIKIIEVFASSSVLWLFQVGHVVQIGEVRSCLLSTNDFHAKTKNERFAAAGSRYIVKTSNLHWTNQIIDLWRCRCPSRCHFVNSLLSTWVPLVNCSPGWAIQHYEQGEREWRIKLFRPM